MSEVKMLGVITSGVERLFSLFRDYHWYMQLHRTIGPKQGTSNGQNTLFAFWPAHVMTLNAEHFADPRRTACQMRQNRSYRLNVCLGYS